MEQNNNSKLPVILSVALIIIIIVFFAFRMNSGGKKPVNTEGGATTTTQVSNTTPQTTNITWSKLIPDIRSTLGSNFLDTKVEERQKISISKEQDITGDGISEALVDLGSGGAYTSFLTLARIDNGKVVIAQFRHEDGNIGPELFLDGASVRHGESVTMAAEKKAIYSLSWDMDENGQKTECVGTAYLWNSTDQIFDFDQKMSDQVQAEACKK